MSSQTPSFGWQLMSVENNDVQQSAYAIATSFLSPSNIESKARWIGAIKKKDSHIPEGRNYHALAVASEEAKKWQQTHPLSKRSIYLRKPFETHGKVKSAIIYIDVYKRQEENPWIRIKETQKDQIILELKSGNYRFEIR